VTRNYFVRSAAYLVVWFGFALVASARASEPPPPGTAATGVLTIKVVGARSAQGKIRVALFQGPEGFPETGSAAVRREEAKIDSPTMSAEVVFRDVPQGAYAVSVLHDENMNGKLDKNFLGIPQEGYGASNNPGKKMRAPNFDEAKFLMKSPAQTIEIKLIY
jgi:uncharacterized protein (DUF2141 family)